jgi:hypothetical protein
MWDALAFLVFTVALIGGVFTMLYQVVQMSYADNKVKAYKIVKETPELDYIYKAALADKRIEHQELEILQRCQKTIQQQKTP